MPFGNKAGQGSSIALAKHIWYNPKRDRVETDVPLATTLSSLFLDRHISLSSGGAAMYFRDHTRNIDAVPCISGLYDQKLEKNHGFDGMFGATTRVYGDLLLNIESIGPVHASDIVQTDVGFIMPFSASTQGYESVLGEAIVPEDKVVVTVYDGREPITEDSISVFQQVFRGLTLAAGDTHMWWYDTPSDFIYGDQLRQIVHIHPGGILANSRILLERSAVAAPVPWRKAFFRTFVDTRQPTTSDVSKLEAWMLSLHADTNDIVTKRNGLLLTRAGDTITWPAIT